MTVHMTEADELALSEAIRCVGVGWRRFAEAAAAGELAEAELWAELAFGLWGSLAPVDPVEGDWCARFVFLLFDDG